jgi:hypothetical protein
VLGPARQRRRSGVKKGLAIAAAARGCLPTTAMLPGPHVFSGVSQMTGPAWVGALFGCGQHLAADSQTKGTVQSCCHCCCCCHTLHQTARDGAKQKDGTTMRLLQPGRVSRLQRRSHVSMPGEVGPGACWAVCLACRWLIAISRLLPRMDAGGFPTTPKPPWLLGKELHFDDR